MNKALKSIVVVFSILLAVETVFAIDSSPDKRFEENEKLVRLIKKNKHAIVAVGTHYFKDTPMSRFLGTGFAVGDGSLIVTNAHTIEKIEEEKRLKQLRIFHKQFDSRGMIVSLLAKDEIHDLALLKIERENLPTLQLGNSDSVEEGVGVAFTGYPIGLILGLNPTTHTGIISAISPIILPSPSARSIKKEMIDFLRHPYDIFQLDATAYPGNSGSPVFRISTGEVIGVINMVFVKGKKENLLKAPSGITYAIPAKYVRALLKNLVRKK